MKEKHKARITVLVGNYGSGKTEIAINMALDKAKRGRVTLVDLDIVNPYFRSSEHKEMLQKRGIAVIHPNFAMTNLDVPSLPASVYSVFADTESAVIMDVGGDPTGAAALGGYSDRFALSDYEALFVVNARRPFTQDAQSVVSMLRRVEERARIRASALVNNTNMAAITTAEDLLFGQDVAEEAARMAGLPVRFVCGKEKVLREFASARGEFMGELMPIEIFMRKAWMDEN